MDRIQLGVKLAQIRQSKDKTAQVISHMIGKASNYVHYVETGKVNVKFDTLMAICDALEIKPRILFE